MLNQAQVVDLDNVRNIAIVPPSSRTADRLPPVDWRIDCRASHPPAIATRTPIGEYVIRQGGDFITLAPDQLPRLIARLYRLARGA
jgi:hypothetical protein